MKRLLISEKGLTLVELLMALALVSIVTIIIINYLLSGMKNYEVTSKQTEIHNDANYVMSLLSNEIYQAKKVDEVNNDNFFGVVLNDEPGLGEERIELGIHKTMDNKPYVKRGNGQRKYLSSFHFDGSSIEKQDEEESQCEGEGCEKVVKTVEIKLVVKGDEHASEKLTLLNEISYIESKQDTE